MRLQNSTLGQVEQARLPDYDRRAVKAGIVHLGIGNFHRAHQAVYIDRCLKADLHWGITGVSLRRSDMAEALNPQDGLFGVVARGAAGSETRIIGSVLKVLSPTDGIANILAQMVAPEIRIVTLTVTEKAYCHDPATGALDMRHPDIVADLAWPHTPRSVPGILVEALARRRAAGVAPFTVVSCDNLPSNGKVVRLIVKEFAARRDGALSAWIEDNVAFPCSMVDRIVPATTADDRVAFEAMTGVRDAWPVVTENFSQWVLEDHFPQGRPDLNAAGVELVADVAPYEQMKLRMLNGAHSTLAYYGLLLGHETVFEAMSDPALSSFVQHMWREDIIPTLAMSHGKSLAYADALRERFLNTSLRHRLSQIAMDVSQKIPQRLLNTIRDRISAGRRYDKLALALAAWVFYLSEGEVNDPLAARFLVLSTKYMPDVSAFASALLDFKEIFGELCENTGFRHLVVKNCLDIARLGPKAVLEN